MAHQRAKAVDGEVRGGRTVAPWCLDGGGQSGEEGDDVGDCGPPSTGWLHREEEEDEAVQRDTSGELDAAQDGGDLCGKAAAAGARHRIGLGFGRAEVGE